MKGLIITGVSRGLGSKIATLALEKGWKVAGISRTPGSDVLGLRYPGQFFHFPFDLEDLSAIPGLLSHILTSQFSDGVTDMGLINNAAVIEPIKMTENLEPQDLSRHFTINLTAPMVLTGEFIRQSQGITRSRSVVMVSSGAAIRAKSGWGAYCASKAGLEMFVKVVSKEQEGRDHGVKIESFDPGIMDTDMQGRIRKSAPQDFPEVERFQGFKDQGQLLDPVISAQKILELIDL